MKCRFGVHIADGHLALFSSDPTVAAYAQHEKSLIASWRSRREKFVKKRTRDLLANETAQRIGLGVPVNRPTSTRDGMTIKYQQFEREDSARPVPPWPWPLVNLLDTLEKHFRLELI